MTIRTPIDKRVIDMHGYIQRAEYTDYHARGSTQLHLFLRSDFGQVTANFSFPTGALLDGVDPFDCEREVSVVMSLPLKRELVLREKISAHLKTMDLQALEAIDCLLGVEEKCK